MITPLYNPANEPMRVAAFMSGSGTNVVKLFEHQLKRPDDYKIEVIFTDKPTKSNAAAIASQFNVPFEALAYMQFFESRGLDRKDRANIPVYYDEVARLLKPFGVQAIALGGFMRLVPPAFLQQYPLTINVHPADLSLKDWGGKRRFTGEAAMELAMAAREPYARATTFIVDEGEDTGELLLLSQAMHIDYACTAKRNQDQLKEVGDWVIFPRTLALLSQGRFGRDESGMLCLDDRPIPNGRRLEQLL